MEAVTSGTAVAHQSQTHAASTSAESHEGLICLFQPIVATASGSPIFGHECLTRLLDGEGHQYSISQLIESAQDRSLKRMLHSHVLRHCIQSAANQIGEMNLFINVSPQLFYEDNTHWQEISELISSSGMAPQQIVWEIVETDRSDDDRNLVRFARECRAINSRVALDDWGSQLRSLELLETLRPDFVKLEKELISSCSRDQFRATIVSNVLQMCRQLEIKSVVEGIETIDDWNWVRKNRADFAQGYYLGMPEPKPVRDIRPAKSILGHHFDLAPSISANVPLTGV